MAPMGLGLDSGGMGLDALLGSATGSAPAENPSPPYLTWNSTSADATPDFLVDLPRGWGDYRDAAENDHLIIEYQLQAGGAWTEYVDHTLTAGDITNDTISVTGVSSLSNGDYYFRGRITRGLLSSSNSSNVSVTIAVASHAVELEGSTDLIELEGTTYNIQLEAA